MPPKTPYEKRIVVYIDILGVKDFSTKLAGNPKLRETIFKSLRGIKRFSTTLKKNPLRQHHLFQKWEQMMPKARAVLSDCQATFFSDHIVISKPAKIGLIPIEWLITDASFLINCLHMNGFVVRGAITVGNLFHKNNVVFGEALVEAHRIESQIAKTPRIIFSDAALELLKRKTPNIYEREILCDPSVVHIMRRAAWRDVHNNFLRKDGDGLYFLNTFTYWWEKDEEDSYQAYLAAIKDHAVQNLRRYKNNPKIFFKWDWFNKHFNNELLRLSGGTIFDFVSRFSRAKHVTKEIYEKVIPLLSKEQRDDFNNKFKKSNA